MRESILGIDTGNVLIYTFIFGDYFPVRFKLLKSLKGSPDSSAGKESACNAGNPGSILGLGRFPGEGIATHSNILGLS